MRIFYTVKIDEDWVIIGYPYGLANLSEYVPMPKAIGHGKVVWKYKGGYYYRKGLRMVNAPQR